MTPIRSFKKICDGSKCCSKRAKSQRSKGNPWGMARRVSFTRPKAKARGFIHESALLSRHRKSCGGKRTRPEVSRFARRNRASDHVQRVRFGSAHVRRIRSHDEKR